jgi:hypothetical protein
VAKIKRGGVTKIRRVELGAVPSSGSHGRERFELTIAFELANIFREFFGSDAMWVK